MRIFTYQPPGIPWLDVRHLDEDLIVINKPSKLLSNPGRAAATFDCALTRLQQCFPGTLLVHRLDCDTSGIMIFARNKRAESKLKTQFQDRKTQKIYLAQVQGIVTETQGIIDIGIMPDKSNPPLQLASQQGKSATTHYRVLQRRQNTTLMQLKPITGRTHQLRVHMHSLGHPIVGDDFYPQQRTNREATEQICSRLQLHASSLSFFHPATGKPMTFKSHCSF